MSTSSPSPHEPFSALVSRELGAPAGTGEQWIHETSRGLAGIALSGGGIRSATFNLGLLQGLQKLGLIGAFDYLSTVSGGGYIGGFWTRWRARVPTHGPDGQPTPKEQRRDASFPAPRRNGAEAEDVRHLREFSNFLTPRLGLLTVDTGRAVVAAVSAILPSLLAALSLIVLALLAWTVGARLLLSEQALVAMEGRFAWATPSLLILAGVLAAALLAAERMTPVDIRRGTWLPYLAATAASLAAVGAAWWWITGTGALAGFWGYSQRLPLVSLAEGAGRWRLLFLPCAALAAGALALVVLRVGTSRFRPVLNRPSARAAFERAQSRLWLFAAVWGVVALLWCLGLLATSRMPGFKLPAANALAATAVALAALFARVQKALSSPSSKPSGQMMTRLRPLLPQLLAYTVLALIVVTLAAVLAFVGRPSPLGPELGWDWAAAAGRLDALALGAGLATLAALLLFNPNEVGLHSFYKGRLVRAYLGASCEPPNRSTGDVPHDDVFLHDLPDRDRPFHLVCCAVNDLSSAGELSGLNRGAVSGVLSRVGLSVGPHWARWDADAPHYVPTLGAAMTASGAAFNSLMGAKSIQFGPAVRFLAAALGLRLGLWMAHPRRLPGRRRRPRAISLQGIRVFGRSSGGRKLGLLRSRARRVGRTLARVGRRWFVGAPFYRELLGIARANGATVHLSDGGHFENMAVYELVRRHCLFIVASDCGQDSNVAFDDLGNLVRKVREDFAVDIRIDLAPLRPDPQTGRARQHMVAGDIHYPNGDTGVLLLFKPTLVGSEPADVMQYRARNPVFPHESTGDQFYDEAQWESYRRLGEHAATEAFERIVAGLADPAGTGRAELFGRARFEWLPLPDGHAERAGGVGDRIAELNARLREEDCRGLMGEVQIELAGVPADPPAAGEPTARRRAREARVLAASLDAIRHALRTLEELYNAEDLERTHAHPANLGVVNYFGRWAHAPTVRAWWPVLRTLHAPPFVRFVERLYGLRAGGGEGPGTPARLNAAFDGAGYAAACWRNQHGAPADAGGRRVVAYELRVDGRWLQAGLLPCMVTDAGVAWEAGDFYVAPGLWGCGLGTDFLSRLARGAEVRFAGGEDGGAEPEWLMVRVSTGEADRAADQRRIADDVQMYREQGFAELTVDSYGQVLMDGVPHATLELTQLPQQWQRQKGRWMIAPRAVVKAPQAQQQPVPVPA